MKFANIGTTSIGFILLFATACGAGSPPPPPSFYNSKTDYGSTGDGKKGGQTVGGKPTPGSKEALNFTIGETVNDPTAFTFGMLKLTAGNYSQKPIETANYLYVSNPKTLSESDKTELETLCRSIGISSDSAEMVEVSDSGSANKPVYLTWRSFFKNSTKESLSKLLLADQKSVLCVFKINLSDQADIPPYFVVFDPIPTAKSVIKGKFDLNTSVTNGLMIPVESSNVINVSDLIPVTGAGEFKLGITALTKESIKSNPESTKVASCLLSGANGSTNLLNPKNALKSKFLIEGSSGFEVGKAEPQAVDGRTLKSCANIKASVVEQAVELEHDCKNYQDVKNEGLEAGCQWNVEVSNKADSENVISVRIALPKVDYKTLDLTAVDKSLTTIPASPKNPVRSKSLRFTNFDAAQLKSMEQVFDVWIATEPKSFEADVGPFMKSVNLASCSAGVLGFAGIGSGQINMCLGAKLSESAINKANDPHRLILQLITASHEVRHAIKWQHDFDERSYKPCEGTAASASTMHAVLVTCQEEYCFVMRGAAKREYIAELKYSLNGDNRRFQGQCKMWSDDIGIKDGEL